MGTFYRQSKCNSLMAKGRVVSSGSFQTSANGVWIGVTLQVVGIALFSGPPVGKPSQGLFRSRLGTMSHPMIIFDLCCEHDHKFEGWFHSADAFESQLDRQMVCCPQCDSCDVRRVPSAVSIGTHHRESDGGQQQAPSRSNLTSTAVMPAGAQALAIYRQLVQAMVNNSEDVGSSFADEARKIHYNEAPERPIRGNASEEECESLRDEGIPILHLPAIKDEDLN